MKKLACLLVAVLTIAGAMAQITSATLRGEVKNQSDERLVGATIVLSHTVTGRSYAVVADDKGYYSLHGIRPDDGYMLEISFVGYKPYLRQDVVMRVGEEVVEDVVLVESTEIEAVVVTATPHQEAEVVGKFGEKSISQMPTISRSIYDVVRLMPQVTPVKGGGISYGGVSNRYNSFMVNGGLPRCPLGGRRGGWERPLRALLGPQGSASSGRGGGVRTTGQGTGTAWSREPRSPPSVGTTWRSQKGLAFGLKALTAPPLC